MIKHKHQFESYYEEAKFMLTYKVSLLLVIFLPILILTYLFNQNTPVYPSLVSFLLALFSLVYLRKSKNYKVIAMVWAILALFLNVVSIIFFSELYHFADAFWMVGAAMFAFFTLSKNWGWCILGINVLTLMYFSIFDINSNILALKTQTSIDSFGLCLNVGIGGLIAGALINEFIKVNLHARESLESANDAIQNQYDTILDQNKEKTVMLKEIHHRVKNNLQVITSLLRLQSREFDNPKAKDKFKESINRVGAMALIHERMYQAEDMGKIDLSDYIKSLVNDLVSSYSVKKNIIVDVESELEYIGNKSVVSFALIINELSSNSLKHAFVNVDHCSISIKVKAQGNKISMIYQDSGNWIEPISEDSFGLELIDVLVDQLDGHYTRSYENGTSYSFVIGNLSD